MEGKGPLPHRIVGVLGPYYSARAACSDADETETCVAGDKDVYLCSNYCFKLSLSPLGQLHLSLPLVSPLGGLGHYHKVER